MSMPSVANKISFANPTAYDQSVVSVHSVKCIAERYIQVLRVEGQKTISYHVSLTHKHTHRQQKKQKNNFFFSSFPASQKHFIYHQVRSTSTWGNG